jgi:hypothetical protein
VPLRRCDGRATGSTSDAVAQISNTKLGNMYAVSGRARASAARTGGQSGARVKIRIYLRIVHRSACIRY